MWCVVKKQINKYTGMNWMIKWNWFFFCKSIKDLITLQISELQQWLWPVNWSDVFSVFWTFHILVYVGCSSENTFNFLQILNSKVDFADSDAHQASTEQQSLTGVKISWIIFMHMKHFVATRRTCVRTSRTRRVSPARRTHPWSGPCPPAPPPHRHRCP